MINYSKKQVYKSAASLSLGIVHVIFSSLVLPGNLAANAAELAVNRSTYLKNTQNQDGGFGGQGRPGSRDSGAGRGGCLTALENSSESVTALIPETSSRQTTLEKTTFAHPTFLIYVPYKTQEPLQGEFELQDNQDNPMVRMQFTTSNQPGYVSITIPKTEKGLEVGKEYRWYFYLYCDNKKPLAVSGWITRVNVTPEMQAQLKLPQNQSYEVYWDNLIWYDAIAALAELRLKNPQDPNLAQEWTRLLQSAELSLPNTPPVGSVVITP